MVAVIDHWQRLAEAQRTSRRAKQAAAVVTALAAVFVAVAGAVTVLALLYAI